jgi:hypothetical protein
MAFDAHKNLAVSTVATAPTPATSGTSVVVTAGEGVRFPAPPFNATLWPANATPTPANAEVVRVTARATDTLTIARAQEGSTARAVGVGDLIAQTITAKTLTDLETQAAIKAEANTFTATQTLTHAVTPELVFFETSQPANLRGFRLVGNSQLFLFQTVNDAGAALQTPLILDRLGSVKVAADIFEKGRPTAQGHWINVPNSPGNFSATGGTMTIAAYFNQAYTLIGKTLIYGIYLQVTVGGAPSALHIALPAGITSANYAAGPFLYGATVGMMQTSPSGAAINLYRDATGGVAWVAGTYFMIGTLPMQIT